MSPKYHEKVQLNDEVSHVYVARICCINDILIGTIFYLYKNWMDTVHYSNKVLEENISVRAKYLRLLKHDIYGMISMIGYIWIYHIFSLS